jgi:hypothetical protein
MGASGNKFDSAKIRRSPGECEPQIKERSPNTTNHERTLLNANQTTRYQPYLHFSGDVGIAPDFD